MYNFRRDPNLPEVVFGDGLVFSDVRGNFRRLIDVDSIKLNLEVFSLKQSNFSSNKLKGTWRGFHAQRIPHAETKIVTCTRGSVLDFALDVRIESTTYGRYTSVVLSQDNGEFIIIPKGFAHGYLTLEDDSNIVYFVDEVYSPQHEFGINVFDPSLELNISSEIKMISDKDKSLPNLKRFTL
jgi:dTDP-4-dehydrorhamnose 3,5-epimerase